MSTEKGYLDGEKCNRDGCEGIIYHSPEGSCSCHINPPCSYCTDDGAYCPECDWSNADDNREVRRKELENPKPVFVWDSEAAKRKRIEQNVGKVFEVIKYFDDHAVATIGSNLNYEEADKLLTQYQGYPATYVSYQMREQ